MSAGRSWRRSWRSSVLPQFDAARSGAVACGMRRSRAWSGVDERHALITVAVTVVTAGAVSTRYLVVPVARDGAAGWWCRSCRRLRRRRRSGELEPGAARAADRDGRGAEVEDVLARFFRRSWPGVRRSLSTWCRRACGSRRWRSRSSWWRGLARAARAERGRGAVGAGDGAGPRSGVGGGVRAALTGCGWCAGTAGTWRRSITTPKEG